MLVIGTLGVTLIAMSYFEKREKIYINRNILYIILIIFAMWMGIEVMKMVNNTFLLNI